jgi:hypothetical protein
MDFIDRTEGRRYFSLVRAGEFIAQCRIVKGRDDGESGVIVKLGRESAIMKSGWTVLVVGSLFLAAGVGRSQDGGKAVGPMVPAFPTGDIETASPAAAKRLTLPQRLQEWAKLRVAGEAEAEPLGPAPKVAAEPAPPLPPPPVAAVSPAVPPGPPCMSGPGHRACREQLREWLTYRPLCHCCCNCIPKCAACCPPPLYAFFIGPCCVNTTGAGCRPSCGHGGCCACGQGNDRFQIWTPSRGLLFWRE